MTSKTKALFLTARPKTLAAALVPILVATALYYALQVRRMGEQPATVAYWISFLAALSATFIQIGTNFINDALDFYKGADSHTRLGDARASQSGWFSPKQVMGVGFLSLALALVCGIPLVVAGGWPIFWVGVISLVMAYGYTGGPWPLAYVGLGDLFVILFFGLIAVGGVFYLHARELPLAAVIAGLQVGLLATVLIAINNLRDLEEDKKVGKKTLAVRLGPKLGRVEVFFLVVCAYGLGVFWAYTLSPWAFWLPLLALPLAINLIRTLFNSGASRAYNKLLAKAALLHMAFGALLSVGLVIS